jgi:vacuolar-type H+-ATPase subunit H
VKRALYNLDNISDQSQKEKRTQGLKDAITVAAKVLEKIDDDAHKDKLSY